MIPEIPRGKWLVIRTDGTEVWYESKPTIYAIEKAIGATMLDFVTLRIRGDQAAIVMAVDDHGYETEVSADHGNYVEIKPTRALKPVNEKATELYLARCKPGTTHQIVGDVAICNDEDFADTETEG
jgi:hypothetical protein